MNSTTYLPDYLFKRYPIFSRVSNRCRRRRAEQFRRLMEVGPETTILDVGGQPYYWANFPVKAQITCLNLNAFPGDIPENVRLEIYDGGEFPFADRSFDIVHSNSVIEHVGDYRVQRRFAQEVMRVGKAYWVQSPNFFFPYEPHAQFPFYQFLPPNWKKLVGQNWRKSGYPYEELLSIQLLTKAQLLDLFPGASLLKEKFLALTKSFCVYRGE